MEQLLLTLQFSSGEEHSFKKEVEARQVGFNTDQFA